MPRKRRITFAGSAVAGLEGIRAWYIDLEVPEVGERLLREVMAAVERLGKFPESGPVVPELGITRLREVIHPPFRIVYRREMDRLRIVRVWRSERPMRMP
jgi:toxin ParE1/3/4